MKMRLGVLRLEDHMGKSHTGELIQYAKHGNLSSCGMCAFGLKEGHDVLIVSNKIHEMEAETFFKGAVLNKQHHDAPIRGIFRICFTSKM